MTSSRGKLKHISEAWLIAAIAIVVCADAGARGVSPYLPLNMSPQIERQIDRVLILAGKNAMRRPIPAAVVLDALSVACKQDRIACREVDAYLRQYMHSYGFTSARIEGGLTDGDSEAVLPNQRGRSVDSSWQASASGYFQWNDHVLLNAGVVANDNDVIPTGSLVSLGWDFAQLDIGYRDHWLSPLTDSSSLISTEAPTMPSVTLSNYAPITPLGFWYEVFGAEMSSQENIVGEDGLPTSGKPRLAGLQLGVEPVRGFALALNRVTQYGGGSRGGSGVSDFFDALFTTSNNSDTSSSSVSDQNRVAAITSSMVFPGRVPFAVYFEYAGEDNTFDGKHRLGATNLSLGIDFPVLGRSFDAGYELSEWQTSWYVHQLYPEGLTNEGRVIGHWFGDHRLFGDDLGGRSHMLRAGWRLPSADYVRAKYRTLELDPRWAFGGPPRPYETMHLLELTYSTLWDGRGIDAQLQLGRDVFGESFGRLSASFDFAKNRERYSSVASESPEDSDTAVFVDVGVQYSRVREYLLLQFQQRDTTAYEANYHVGIGARRPVSKSGDLGVRLEIDRIHGFDLVSIRAIDYRHRFGRKLAAGAFFGAARYDITLAAQGYYFGAGVQYRDILPGWDIGLDYRNYDKLTRDKGLPTDPASNPGLPRRVIDIQGLGLYVSKRW
jgi:hypothetical protein